MSAKEFCFRNVTFWPLNFFPRPVLSEFLDKSLFSFDQNFKTLFSCIKILILLVYKKNPTQFVSDHINFLFLLKAPSKTLVKKLLYLSLKSSGFKYDNSAGFLPIFSWITSKCTFAKGKVHFAGSHITSEAATSLTFLCMRQEQWNCPRSLA